MVIQIRFDTDGITSGSVTDPNGATTYSFESKGSLEATGGEAEGFVKSTKPQITELVSALNCEPSTAEGQTTFADLFAQWPAGDYTFEGEAKGAKFEAKAALTHFIPAGPEIVTPAEGSIVPDAPLVIQWNAVTDAILTDNPNLGPVDVIGYHIHVEENVPDVTQTTVTVPDASDVELTPEFDIDVDGTQTSVTIPEQYLNPSTVYRLEVLAIDQSGNQTISEGSFCTTGVAACASEDEPAVTPGNSSAPARAHTQSNPAADDRGRAEAADRS
jgi:hypothetical protein